MKVFKIGMIMVYFSVGSFISMLPMMSFATHIVPFQNVLIKPNVSTTVNYTFGINSVIFCYTDTVANVGNVNWTFKGRRQSGVLPILLSNNAIFEGSRADPNGSLTIKNNITQAFSVNCLFAY